MHVCLVFEWKTKSRCWHGTLLQHSENLLQNAHVNRISALLMKRWWQVAGALLLFHRNNFLRLLKGFLIEHLIKSLLAIFALWQCKKGGISWSLLHFRCLKTWWLFKEAVTTSLQLTAHSYSLSRNGSDTMF